MPYGETKKQSQRQRKGWRHQPATTQNDGGDEQSLDDRRSYVFSFQWTAPVFLFFVDEGLWTSWPLRRRAASRLAMRQNRCGGAGQEQIANHADQGGMSSSGTGTGHLYA